ncbi:MAG: GTPase domain-containing protein [Vicinamibacteria bacterium]|nr:GTPase domain-containing protein [Vicinamibacteria bacterium]
MQVTAKIVFYGPGLCGKTTNLQYIHGKTASHSRGEMVSLETETDRTLFFDLLPLDVGVISGMKVRLQLYTVPGQVFYNATRKLVLKGVDGIVFVADSQKAALEANVESIENLRVNLAEQALQLRDLPLVIQYNKRDLRNILPMERLEETLNPNGIPSYEAAALHGIGVFETLKAISRLTLVTIRKKLAAEGIGQQTPVKVERAVKRPSAVPLYPGPVAATGLDPLAGLIEVATPPEVEFAEEDTDRHFVRPVATKEKIDIQGELSKLRLVTETPVPGRIVSDSKEMEKRLKDVLVSVSDNPPKQEIKRKTSLDIPAALLRSASALRVHLSFDGDDEPEWIHDALTIRLAGNRKLERLILHIDFDLKGKGKSG